jgi:hypothetical protein
LLEQNTIIQSVDTLKDPPGRPSFIDSLTINLWNDYTTLCGSCIVAIKTIGNKLRLLFAKSDTEQFALIKQAISYINNTPTWHTKSDVKKRYKPVGFQPFGTFNADATKLGKLARFRKRTAYVLLWLLHFFKKPENRPILLDTLMFP